MIRGVMSTQIKEKSSTCLDNLVHMCVLETIKQVLCFDQVQAF